MRANPYTGSVASALRKCQLLLETDCATTLACAAIHEAAVLQLWRAYRAFLAELAFQLNLDSEPESAQALAERARVLGKTCGQAVELRALCADPDSWLARLQQAWVQLWSFSAENSAKRQQSANLIPLQILSAPTPLVLSDELLQDWYAALEELVHRQRAQMEEW